MSNGKTPANAVPMVGKTFGRLTVMADSGERKSGGQIGWSCRCSCGALTVVAGANLRSGHSLSCGCYAKKHDICSIDGCGKPHKAHSWCDAHYYRFLKHGDPLGNAERHKNRKVSAVYLNEVVLPYQGDDCLTWPHSRNYWGYATISTGGKKHFASRLVCEMAYGPPPTPKHEAAHSCGKGHEACVNPRHLRWATHKENMADRHIHGTANGWKFPNRRARVKFRVTAPEPPFPTLVEDDEGR